MLVVRGEVQADLKPVLPNLARADARPCTAIENAALKKKTAPLRINSSN